MRGGQGEYQFLDQFGVDAVALLRKGEVQVAEDSQQDFAHGTRALDRTAGIRAEDRGIRPELGDGDESAGAITVDEMGLPIDREPSEEMGRKVAARNPQVEPVGHQHGQDGQSNRIALTLGDDPEEVGVSGMVESGLVGSEHPGAEEEVAQRLLIVVGIVEDRLVG
jgi:hypothetical protein